MKIRYYIYLVIGATTGIMQVIVVPLYVISHEFSLGNDTPEKVGGIIGLLLYGTISFFCFRGAYRVNRKIKAKKQRLEYDRFLEEPNR